MSTPPALPSPPYGFPVAPATVKQALMDTERETWAEDGRGLFRPSDALAALAGLWTAPAAPDDPAWLPGEEPGPLALLQEARDLSFGQGRERLKDRMGPLSMAMAHMDSLEILAARIREAGHPTAIVCGAGFLGRLAAAALARTGVRVLALTDRNLRVVRKRSGSPPVVSLEVGLSLAPAAALVTALASDKAVTDELAALCRKHGFAPPALFRIALV